MKKGVALVWVLILSSILLIISSTMVSYITKESRFSVQIEESSAAYSAARSGVEWATEQLSTNPEFAIVGQTLTIGQSSATITVTNPDSGDTVIQSTGVKGTVRRKLEYKLSDLAGTFIPIAETATTPGTNTEGFTFSFDITGNVPNAGEFGLEAPEGNGRIWVNFTPGGLTFQAHENLSGRITSAAPITINSFNPANEYRVRIKYWKDTAALIKVQEKTVVAGAISYQCRGTAMLDLSDNFNLGNLTSIRRVGGTVATDPVPPNNSYYLFDSIGIDLRLDNNYIIY